MSWTLIFVAQAALVLSVGSSGAQETPPPQDSPFVGAEACQACHEAIHTAWSATSHAKALLRLGPSDRESGECIRCHVTGSPEQIAAEGANPRLPGVQCEACHGAGRAHVDAAEAGTTPAGQITKTPNEQACTRCHNKESPHYSPFFYAAMRSLVHRT